MFLAGGQDDWTAAPRPVWVWVKDAVGLVLAMVCAVALVLFLYAVIP